MNFLVCKIVLIKEVGTHLFGVSISQSCIQHCLILHELVTINNCRALKATSASRCPRLCCVKGAPSSLLSRYPPPIVVNEHATPDSSTTTHSLTPNSKHQAPKSPLSYHSSLVTVLIPSNPNFQNVASSFDILQWIAINEQQVRTHPRCNQPTVVQPIVNSRQQCRRS